MADRKFAYAADAQLTITLANLASSTTLLAGQESTAVDNGTTKYLDFLLSGKITTGTSPTTAKQIEIHVVAPIEDTPTWPDVFDGVDSVETITSAGIKNAICKTAMVISTDATSDRVYPFGPISVATLFGGVCPKTFAVFVTHDTGVNLKNSAGDQQISVQGIYETVL